MAKDKAKALKTLPALPVDWDEEKDAPINRPPKGVVRSDGSVILSAEEGDGLLDYYGEFRGGYPYIHPKIEEWAKTNGFFLEWENPGCVLVCDA